MIWVCEVEGEVEVGVSGQRLVGAGGSENTEVSESPVTGREGSTQESRAANKARRKGGCLKRRREGVSSRRVVFGHGLLQRRGVVVSSQAL